MWHCVSDFMCAAPVFSTPLRSVPVVPQIPLFSPVFSLFRFRYSFDRCVAVNMSVVALRGGGLFAI